MFGVFSTEPQSLEGIWWLPSNPDDELTGTLEVAPDRSTILSLIGQFKDFSYGALNQPKRVERIFGVVAGKLVTLDGCFLTFGGMSAPGFDRTKVYVSEVFFGEHFLSDSFSEMSFEFEGAEEWLGVRGFEITEADFWNRRLSLHYEQPPNLSFEIDANVHLEIRFGTDTFPAFSGKRSSFQMVQKPRVVLVYEEPVSLKDAQKYAFKLWRFIRFAYDQRTQFSGVYLKSPDVVQEIQGELRPVPLTYATRGSENSNYKFDPMKQLLPFNFLCGDKKSFARWFSLYEELQPALNLHFSVDHQDGFYVEQEFLARVSSLEVAHRRTSDVSAEFRATHKKRLTEIFSVLEDSPHLEWLRGKLIFAHEPTLNQRLSEIVSKVLPIFGGAEQVYSEQFISQVVGMRNHLTHYNRDTPKKSLEGVDLTRSLVKLRSMFVVYVLLLLGYDASSIRDFVSSPFGLKHQLDTI
jgi:hypothetical protein